MRSVRTEKNSTHVTKVSKSLIILSFLDKEFMQNLFTEAVVKEKFLKLNL